MPETFGRYQLLDRIGVGGMGEVFRARLEVPAGAEKILVIKRIVPSFSSDPEFIRLFVNEAKVALPLTHGNIVPVFEFGEIAGQYFLAMEYIHGQNLQAVLSRCRETGVPLPLPLALFVASEVAKGLSYAHGFTTPQGARVEVVHLDVSPPNVLVSYDGGVKLTDFGIAKVRATSSSRELVIRGKAAYLAPEQLGSARVDGRTDVYALGCVLYEMLTGRRPFDAPTDTETVELSKTAQIPPPSSVRAQLAPHDALVLKALARDPAERSGAAELQVALQQALFAADPGFGPASLATFMREQFAWELAGPVTTESGSPRDRLLFQLSRANVEVDGERATSELLELRTVALPKSPAAGPGAKRALIAAAVVGLLGVGSLAGWLLGDRGGDGVAAPVPAGPTGRLSVNSWPSATVFLDGKRLPGGTPLFKIEVPHGDHTLIFVNPELGLSKQVEVSVGPGMERTLAVKLER